MKGRNYNNLPSLETLTFRKGKENEGKNERGEGERTGEKLRSQEEKLLDIDTLHFSFPLSVNLSLMQSANNQAITRYLF